MGLKQLNNQDAAFLFAETPNNHTHTMCIHLYDPATAPAGGVRFKDIIQHVSDRVDNSPIFKRRLQRVPLSVDLPYWVEDEYFDVEHHISHSRLPDPGDWRQLCIQMARHFSKPMDLARPLWDMHVVEGLDRVDGMPPGTFAIATRLHHCCIDGMSGRYFFAAISDRDPQGNPAIEGPLEVAELGDEPSAARIVQRALLSNLKSPMNMMRLASQYAPALADTMQKRLTTKREPQPGVPKTRFNAIVSPHKMFDAASFPLTDLKVIKNAVAGVTLNDVVLALSAGGLKRYLEHHDELPEEPLVAMAPINHRTDDQETKDPSNNFVSMSVKLPTLTEDPLERLRAVHAFTVKSKAAKTGLSARILTDLTRHMPGVTLASVSTLLLTIAKNSAPIANTIISNVPGPQEPLYMCGAKRIHEYGIAPLGDGLGFFVAVFSYIGEVTFNFTSDRNILPDIEFMKECFEEEFEEMLLAARPRKRRTRATRKSRR